MGGVQPPATFGEDMTDIYNIGDKNIEITSMFEDVHRLCHTYHRDGKPDFSITTTDLDISFERKKFALEDKVQGRPARHYPDAFLEMMAVYRQIAERMPTYNTFLFHGSAIAVDGEVYLFTAKSGTGKSTHTRLWREKFGERAIMVNDDKPLLKLTENGILVFGTPWNGKHHLSENIAVPLKALCILERGTDNQIRPITATEARPMLLQQCYRPVDMEALKKTLILLDTLVKTIRLYSLKCNMDMSAVEVAYCGMKGTKDETET